ncbi:MAG: short-chain dehydrogenase [Halobacteriovoraceae bacterium]|nr:short-chain dehydrogenase [Halobacteriovoraceae bacterium]|tara:strand:+ start:10183 stop:10920 length:738 start_codon:yes stop_codon:yes gene_type:complete
MKLNLENKTALVMGSSQGIGRAIAESLIAEGVKVCISSRSADKLEKVASEIGAECFLACDLTKPHGAKELMIQAKELLGRVDILVTNTGGPEKNSFSKTSVEQWHKDYQSLWMSPIEAMHEALPEMKKNNYGRILMVSSIAAKEPLDGLTTSNAFRAGFPGLVKSLVNEYSQFGITFNILLPGYTNTERIQALQLSDEKIKQMVPAGRLGEPRELADLCTFLASDKGSYITGQSIAIDGGVLRSH